MLTRLWESPTQSRCGTFKGSSASNHSHLHIFHISSAEQTDPTPPPPLQSGSWLTSSWFPFTTRHRCSWAAYLWGEPTRRWADGWVWTQTMCWRLTLALVLDFAAALLPNGSRRNGAKRAGHNNSCETHSGDESGRKVRRQRDERCVGARDRVQDETLSKRWRRYCRNTHTWVRTCEFVLHTWLMMLIQRSRYSVPVCYIFKVFCAFFNNVFPKINILRWVLRYIGFSSTFFSCF